MRKQVGSKSVPLEIMKFNMASPALIEASAGTGKTYTITNLVVRALLGLGSKEVALPRPLQIEDLLVVTFTNAATSDLRSRIFERIRAARGAFETFIDNALKLISEALEQENEELVASHYLEKQDLSKVKSAIANGRKRAKKRKAALTIEGRISEDGTLESLANHDFDDSESDYLETKASDYTEDELQHLLLNIDVKAVMSGSNVDPTFYDMITDLLSRKVVPLRHAILLLAQAERKINNASICTIHSFCNSTLTQLYALESGEAFNTELKRDLYHESKEAIYGVWRRLFYKEKCSTTLKDTLGAYNPDSFSQLLNSLGAARHSDPKSAFAGYYLEGFEELMQEVNCPIDIHSAQSLESQLVNWLNDLDAQSDSSDNDAKISILREYDNFLSAIPQKQFEGLYNPQTKAPGYLLDGTGKSFKKDAPSILAGLYKLYSFENEIKGVLASQNHSGNEINQLYAKLPSPNSLYQDNLTSFVSYSPKETKSFEKNLLDICKSIFEKYTTLESRSRKLRHVLLVLVSIIVQQELMKLCQENNVMNNDDVLRRLDYAINNRGAAGERLAELIRKRYPLAMIDEFQDTDPVQYNIFSAIYLTQEALDAQAYCYLIGDPKQSIYAFRGSDINSYLKARQKIIELTHGKGLYTLDTNYRSQPDIVGASNAIFSNELNPNNINPFEEADIPFESVKSGLAKGLVAKKNAKVAPAKPRSFTLEGLDEILFDGSSVPTESNNEGVKYCGAANTYVVAVDLDESSYKGATEKLYAEAAALMIMKLLSDGKIDRKGPDGVVTKSAVKASDIAVLVRKADQSNLVQAELRKLQIQSVFFSDRSSVLKGAKPNNNTNSNDATPPSKEASDILSLMEAMEDSTDRRKVYKVLASNLLCLSAQEYSMLMSSDDIFEYEVKLLNDCAHVWKRYGFMPAFLKWANDPRHCMNSRLLSVNGGERLYTNFCHISEIVQGVHKKNTALATQIHWFNDLINQEASDISEDDSKKRLESEQDQVKIITVHKSKGLEFPIVLMPFLWGVSKENKKKPDLPVVRYYSNEEQHRVLSFNYDEPVPVNTRVPKVDAEGNLLDDYVEHVVESTPKEQFELEEQKEATRLLYVAITRACHVNIFFVHDMKQSTDSKPEALTRHHGTHNRTTSVALPSGEITTPEQENYQASCFVEAVLAHPDKFTVIDGKKLRDAYASFTEDISALHVGDKEILDTDTKRRLELFNAYGYKSEDGFTDRSLNISSIRAQDQVPNVALSFIYKQAIDTSFNIFSYSSLTANHSSNNETKLNYHLGRDENHDDTDLSVDTTEEQLNDLPLVTVVEHEQTPQVSTDESTYLVNNDTCSVSSLVQRYREQNYNSLMIRQTIKMKSPLCHIFPKGKLAGSFMHEILEKIDFEQMKARGYDNYLLNEVIEEVSQTARAHDFMSQSNIVSADEYKMRLGEWFNDVLEAPIVAGKYHCFALADLEVASYEREMEFLMSNGRFDTTQLDELCHEVAQRLLPAHLSYLGENLTLSYSEVVGFVTGSIDLACRFDLNRRLALHERADLMYAIPEDQSVIIAEHMKYLREKFRQGQIPKCQDPELNGAFEEQNFSRMPLSDAYEGQASVATGEEKDYKYYVIDYKSNSMLSSTEELNIPQYEQADDFSEYYGSYSFDNMVKSIYEHRYDLQFMLYTLALYRFLKVRYGVRLDSSYEELESFYDQHIGGVMYLYMRGMQANYLRDKVSKGVFTTKLDFDIVYKLDQIFSGNNDEE
ncbi:UvrD-helicase domain-containing protein [uncultured Anaerobiospirillum sp.]|uniref:UvrD-helicase domain-containing protein n=1 Tax=uncultured Anaerobiospirillum sp. TaxID=265728 RepID=UPI0035A67626